jgi:hypothetical protein
MDADRFDALSRALTTLGSRRTTLGTLLGMLFSGALSGASQETLASRRTRNGKRLGKKAGRAKADRDNDAGEERRTGSIRDHHTPQGSHPREEQTLDPTDEAVARDEVTAASDGCRPTRANCTKPGQCCSGRCASNGTCQLCTRASQCPPPPVSEPCKKRVCTGAGKCVIRNKDEGDECSDGLACTTGDVCDGNGRCVGTPDDALCLSGETCVNGDCLCASNNVVCGGACVAGNCCDGDSGVLCPNGRECCSPKGCKDLQNDIENCGGCGISCDPEKSNVCSEGKCLCRSESGDSECIGGEKCNKFTGCACPSGDPTCKPVCKVNEIECGKECLDCPPPPSGIPTPGIDRRTCCSDSYCRCNGKCCSTEGDCFQTFDPDTSKVVDEFCCTDRGGVVCGNECCQGPSCETGCFRMNPVGGSYRRPGR